MVGLIATSKKAYTKRLLPGNTPTHASTKGPPALAGRSGSVSVRSLLLSPGSWCEHDFVCALQEWSFCLSQSCGSPVIKLCWASKSESLGIPSPCAGYPGWVAGAQNLHNSVRTSLVLLFSSLLVAHLAASALCFPDNSVGKESTCHAGDPRLIPRLGRSAGKGIGYPLQCSWASLVAQLERIHLQCGRTWV